MISAREIAQIVSLLKPGQAMRVSRYVLLDVACIPGWTPPESVMENIIGSAYEYTFYEDPQTGGIVFHRLREPLKNNLRTYVSPDRLCYFKKRSDGFYEVIKESRNTKPNNSSASTTGPTSSSTRSLCAVPQPLT